MERLSWEKARDFLESLGRIEGFKKLNFIYELIYFKGERTSQFDVREYLPVDKFSNEEREAVINAMVDFIEDFVKKHQYKASNGEMFMLLSDNKTLNEIKDKPDDLEIYYKQVRRKLKDFQSITGRHIYLIDGQKVVMQNTIKNYVYFEKYQSLQKKLERDVIDYFNNGEWK